MPAVCDESLRCEGRAGSDEHSDSLRHLLAVRTSERIQRNVLNGEMMPAACFSAALGMS